jgi:hypothetical protein
VRDWIKIRSVAKAAIKAITAEVIVVRNPNIFEVLIN